MKNLLTLFSVLALVWSASAQNELPIDKNTGKVTFLEVVNAEGLTAQQIYDLTKTWAKEKGYVVTEDVAGSKLYFDAHTSVHYPSVKGGGTTEKGIVHFKLQGFFKDGKYRLILTDFVHEGEGKLPDGGKLEAQTAACGKIKMTGRAWVTIKNKTRENAETLIADIKRVIKEVQKDPANNDDW